MGSENSDSFSISVEKDGEEANAVENVFKKEVGTLNRKIVQLKVELGQFTITVA
jgi:hypothetical protein